MREGIDFDGFGAQKKSDIADTPSDVANVRFQRYIRFSFSRWLGEKKVTSPLLCKSGLIGQRICCFIDGVMRAQKIGKNV